jgi:hypothetical protein
VTAPNVIEHLPGTAELRPVPPDGSEDQQDQPAGAKLGPAPEDVVDRLLWRDAQHVLARHQPTEHGCGCCGASWPCTAQRLAERADAASRLPLREGRAARHDRGEMHALPQRQPLPPPARRPHAGRHQL